MPTSGSNCPLGYVSDGDENRSSQGKPAGSFFKFVPTTPRTGTAPIASLDDSPLAAGKVFGLRVNKSGANDYGQGMNTGVGQWIDVDAGKSDLRAGLARAGLCTRPRPNFASAD